MECSICGYKIEGDPGSKLLIQDGTGLVLLDMHTCGKVICFRAATAASGVIMETMRPKVTL